MKATDRLIGILDSDQENQRLELVIETEQTPKLALRLSTYSKGLGWHTQKTIYIENNQAEELQFLLGGARSLLKQTFRNTENAVINELDRKDIVVDKEVNKIKHFNFAERKSA